VSTNRFEDAAASPILSRIALYQDDLAQWRHDIHAHPELSFHERRTAAKVAALLEQWGYNVTTGVGGTGVVATLTNGASQKSVGLRADMDALPITETTGLPYASSDPAKMHACGHDGHVAMLLGAARYLAETRSFNGTLRLIFQPAEEIMEGAKAMVEDGLFRRFPVDAVFGMHVAPELPAGVMGFRSGPAMASCDDWEVVLTGIGGHGSAPEKTTDPVVAGASLVMALQTVVSRNVPPQQQTVVTVGAFRSGEWGNIIPNEAILRLSIRNGDPEMRIRVLERIRAIIMGQTASYGVDWAIREFGSSPVLVNDQASTMFARSIACELFGESRLAQTPLIMAGEDLAFMLQERPGCLCYIGNGDGPNVHNSGFLFNDDILLPGAAYWSALVERFLA
jgi:hippurate hydrolase